MKHELTEKALSLKAGIYQHYKGNFYQIMGVCRHSESLEEMVVYMAMYGSYGWWVRPLDMFFESVEIEGQQVPRFKYIGQNR